MNANNGRVLHKTEMPRRAAPRAGQCLDTARPFTHNNHIESALRYYPTRSYRVVEVINFWICKQIIGKIWMCVSQL